MPVRPEAVGRSFDLPERYEVTRGKIREFADAIGDANPLYRDRDAARSAGHADVVAPPTFAVIVALDAVRVILRGDEVGVDWERVVHGDQSFHHHRPICAGDILATTVTVEKVRAVAGNEFVTAIADVSDQDGQPVARAVSTLVVRG